MLAVSCVLFWNSVQIYSQVWGEGGYRNQQETGLSQCQERKWGSSRGEGRGQGGAKTGTKW